MKRALAREVSWYGGFKVAKVKVQGKKKNRSLQIYSKWFKMADRMLCLYDYEHRKKRVDARWLRLMIKYQAKNTAGWNSISKLTTY